MREIIRLAMDGVGPHVIAAQFNRAKRPVLSSRQTAGVWDGANIANILKSRALLGEFTPTGGQPIAKYYPFVATEAEFYAIQSQHKTRKVQKGRQSLKINNIFGRILQDERGATYTLNGKRLLSMDAIRGLCPYKYFPYAIFEKTFLVWVSEIKLVPHQTNPQVEKFAGELAEIDAKRTATRKAVESMQSGSFESGLQILANLDRQHAAKQSELEAAKAEAHAPAYSTATIAELAGKMAMMSESERIEVRAKLKAAISATVEKIVCTIDELTANATITFRDGSIRTLEVMADGYGMTECAADLTFRHC